MQQKLNHSSVDEVREKLLSAYNRTMSVFKNRRYLQALIILFSTATVLLLAEQSLYLSVSVKSAILVAIILLSVYVAFFKRHSEYFISFETYYREFSRTSELPELKDAMDLQNSKVGNSDLVNAAILQSLSKVEPDRLDNILRDYSNNSNLHKNFKSSFIIGTAAFLVFSATVINFDNAASRTFTFWENYQKPNPYEFNVAPGSVTLEQGEPVRVEVSFLGTDFPEHVTLNIKTTIEESFRDRPMERNSNLFTSMPIEVYNNLQYYISMDEYQSDIYSIDVQLRPRFLELSGQITPPSYTKLGSNNFVYPSSQIRGYKGSELNLSGKLNKGVRSLIVTSLTDSTSLQVQSDSTFTHSLRITKPDTLQFQIEDSTGLTNDNKFQLIIAPLEDEYPMVQIIEPESNLKQINPETIDILYRASDDFGLTSAGLNYELNRAYTNEKNTGSIELDIPNSNTITPYVWPLEELNLKPQDVLTFWITVQDNDGYEGLKTSSSQRITLEIPSMVDYLDNMGEKEDDITSDLKEISETFQQTREQYERFKEKLKNNPENAGYEEKSALKQVQEQQEEVQRQIDELNEKFEELKDEMSRDNILSEETQRAYDELQKLMEEIDDPAFREALEKMQEQLDNMSPEQLRQAMEDLEFNEELYQERLERTIELFKKLKLTSDLDKIAKAFEDLARQEEEAKQSESISQQAQKKETIEEHKKINEQVDGLSENTSDSNRKEVEEYRKSTQERINEITEELKKELEQPDPKTSNEQDESPDSTKRENRQKRIDQYRDMSDNTRDLMDQINQEQMQINIAGLQYVLYSMLNLSLEQEDLTTLVATTENRSQAYVIYARDQQNIESIFSTLSDSLFQLSSQIPQFSNRINQKKLEVEQQLTRSMSQLTERDQSQASIASRQTLGGINEIAYMLANLLEQLQNSDGNGQGGGSGSSQQIMEQLQQSGQQQQQLNQRLQELINDIQGDRLSQDQMERLNQLAEQQNMIRRQLQQLQRSGEFDGDRLGSELQRMIEEMENTINDLRGGSTDAVMIERQQNILSRMLEAEEAIQKRDEEDKREGQRPEDFERTTPPDLTIEELEKQIRNRLNDPNFTKFSPDYQRLIQNYFELLKELQEREIQ
ncbi:hypothetical protein ACKGJO_08565 [Gracilimonas sp. Q87]|uniref:hypothetical protein n=1 Tax=Gracilimonas sp. Q87 TaxID=3384766 RepID=UPI003984601A